MIVGGLVIARSVKFLGKLEATLSDQETREGWWEELRDEIRMHAKSLCCSHIVGYSENCTVIGDVCVLSAVGTAAVMEYLGHPQGVISVSNNYADEGIVGSPSAGYLADNNLADSGIKAGRGQSTDSISSSNPGANVTEGALTENAALPHNNSNQALLNDRNYQSSAFMTPENKRSSRNNVGSSGNNFTTSASDSLLPSSQSLNSQYEQAINDNTNQLTYSDDNETARTNRENSGQSGQSLARANLRSARKNPRACAFAHVPYNHNTAPFAFMRLVPCMLCRRKWVPETLLATVEPPQKANIRGRGQLLEARVCRTRRSAAGEADAVKISEVLPFVEFDLQRQIMLKLKVLGMNAAFGMRSKIQIGNGVVIATASCTAVYVNALPPSPTLSIGRSLRDNKLENDARLQLLQKSIEGLCAINKQTLEIAQEEKTRVVQAKRRGSRGSAVGDSVSNNIALAATKLLLDPAHEQQESGALPPLAPPQISQQPAATTVSASAALANSLATGGFTPFTPALFTDASPTAAINAGVAASGINALIVPTLTRDATYDVESSSSSSPSSSSPSEGEESSLDSPDNSDDESSEEEKTDDEGNHTANDSMNNIISVNRKTSSTSVIGNEDDGNIHASREVSKASKRSVDEPHQTSTSRGRSISRVTNTSGGQSQQQQQPGSTDLTRSQIRRQTSGDYNSTIVSARGANKKKKQLFRDDRPPFILEIDDETDVDIVAMLNDWEPPIGMDMTTLTSMPGATEVPIGGSGRNITIFQRGNISAANASTPQRHRPSGSNAAPPHGSKTYSKAGKHASSSAYNAPASQSSRSLSNVDIENGVYPLSSSSDMLTKQFKMAYLRLCFSLRNMMPCQIVCLSHDVNILEEDTVEIIVHATAHKLALSSRRHSLPSSPKTVRISNKDSIDGMMQPYRHSDNSSIAEELILPPSAPDTNNVSNNVSEHSISSAGTVPRLDLTYAQQTSSQHAVLRNSRSILNQGAASAGGNTEGDESSRSSSAQNPTFNMDDIVPPPPPTQISSSPLPNLLNVPIGSTGSSSGIEVQRTYSVDTDNISVDFGGLSMPGAVKRQTSAPAALQTRRLSSPIQQAAMLQSQANQAAHIHAKMHASAQANGTVHVTITSLSFVPGAVIRNYLGPLQLHFIKEPWSAASRTINEDSLDSFFYQFLSEVNAVARSHVAALGGNALLCRKVVLQESGGRMYRNQSYNLVSITGDVAYIEYTSGGGSGNTSSSNSVSSDVMGIGLSGQPVISVSSSRSRTQSELEDMIAANYVSTQGTIPRQTSDGSLYETGSSASIN
jgi:hypothetical protein